MDASHCRQHLEKLLTAELSALEQLETLFEQEHVCIVNDDVETLDSTAQQRQYFVNALRHIDDERLSLCRSVGMDNNNFGLKKLLQWCDPNQTLQTHWQTCAQTVERCRALNERNGALINSRLKRVEGLLGLLTQENKNEQRVYSAKGSTYNTPGAGRVFNATV